MQKREKQSKAIMASNPSPPSAKDGDVFDVPFDPNNVRAVDIVATRIRTFHQYHPGNHYYVRLIAKYTGSETILKYAEKKKKGSKKSSSCTSDSNEDNLEDLNIQPLPKFATAGEYDQAANEICDILTTEPRSGQFLKLPDTRKISEMKFCKVMTRKEIVAKIAHALRTQKKRLGEFSPSKSSGRKKNHEGENSPSPRQSKRKESMNDESPTAVFGSPDSFSPDAVCPADSTPNSSATTTSVVEEGAEEMQTTPAKSPSSGGRKGRSSTTKKKSKSSKHPKQPPPKKQMNGTTSSSVNADDIHQEEKKDGEPSSATKSKASTPKNKKNGQAMTKLVYEPQACRSNPIDPFIVQCIQLVCNTCSDYQDPNMIWPAFHILDHPLQGHDLENEPSKLRLMRLGLRQRYAGASACGMSPLDFSIKLMKLWGGTLNVVEKEVPIPPTAPSQVKKKVVEKVPNKKSTPPQRPKNRKWTRKKVEVVEQDEEEEENDTGEEEAEEEEDDDGNAHDDNEEGEESEGEEESEEEESKPKGKKGQRWSFITPTTTTVADQRKPKRGRPFKNAANAAAAAARKRGRSTDNGASASTSSRKRRRPTNNSVSAASFWKETFQELPSSRQQPNKKQQGGERKAATVDRRRQSSTKHMKEANHIKLRKQQAMLIPEGVSKEQRASLKGIEIDLNKFQTFLIKEEKLKHAAQREYVGITKQLIAGSGIRHKKWPESSVFHPKKVNLDENFTQLYLDAKDIEKQHGQRKCFLKSAIRELAYYQKYYYDNEIASDGAGGVDSDNDCDDDDEEEEPVSDNEAAGSKQPQCGEKEEESDILGSRERMSPIATNVTSGDGR